MSEPGYARLRATARKLWAVTAFLGLISAALLVVGGAGGLVLLGLTALVGWFSFSFHRRIGGAEVVNTALRRILEGRFVDAEAILAQAPVGGGAIRRSVSMQRALIALWTSRHPDAIRHATDAIATTDGFRVEPSTHMQRAYALGLRAFAEATLGHSEAALRDADAAESIVHAPPETLATTQLVRGMLFSRADRVDALAELLQKGGDLLHEHTPPRMRAVVQALEKRIRSHEVSPYRDPASQGPQEASPLGDWVGKVVPETAGARTRSYTSKTASLDIPVVEGPVRVATTASRTAPRWGMVLGLWVSLIGVFYVLWRILAPTPGESYDPPDESGGLLAVGVGMVAMLAIAVILILRRTYAPWRELSEGRRASAFGDRVTARNKLGSIARAPTPPSIAAAARFELAALDYREANFAGAIDHAEAGVALCARNPATDIITGPALLGLLATARAAAGDTAQAKLQLAAIAKEHATFVGLPSFRFKVLLLSAVREGDMTGASSIASERTLEMTLSRAEDLLVDLVLARRGGADRDEQARIADELRENPEVRAWVEAVAPELAKESASVRVAEETAAAQEDLAEREDREQQEAKLTSAARRPG